MLKNSADAITKTKSCSMVIVGAGLSGTLAARFFHSFSPSVFEAAPAPEISHKAIMRIRDPRVGILLGSDMGKVLVRKNVFFSGTLWDKSNITINNLYSLKVSGDLSYKSVLNLQDAERYLLSGWKPAPNTAYGHLLRGIENGHLLFANAEEIIKIRYDVCISTIPLFHLINCAGFNSKEVFKYFPITVIRANLKEEIGSSVYQTIYFPESEFKTYRASLEANKFIIEAVGEVGAAEIERVVSLFGLDISMFEDCSTYVQSFGKMAGLDDNFRKTLISELTIKHNIYSLGRFAIWKPIRTDEVIKDLEVIQKLISMEDKRRIVYENKLNQLHP